ncbi:hypothetical protein M0R89_20465 (plasmid) [Halorussus limi]|uniref:Uncharacterized protein n=1 Tax=Halorussus limi TaxID=2938695 RepID=A0A8U0I2E8_9EURY|nr:hypothetical protein [Halorussus limi]UPV76844.1 hypothetical protein M0R89_20465 [Halorussus limi]
MKRYRVVSGGAGVVALGCALALGGGPAGGAVGAMLTALGNDYFVVAAFAGVGLLVAASVLASGGGGALRQTETPTPERPVTAPVAGDAVDDALASRTALAPVVGDERREALRERLRTVAVETWVRRDECSREEAEERLDAGTWTDDREAAAFLAGNGPGVEARALALARAEPWSRRGARRAVAELLERERSEQREDERGANGPRGDVRKESERGGNRRRENEQRERELNRRPEVER